MATYSTANLRHGNLLTVIPIIGWSGRGLPLSMSLYHNSANVEESVIDLTRGMGFDLGEGWTTSFSDQLVIDTNEIIVIREDGTRDTFTKNGSVWDPPPGVHDTLTQVSTDWKLLHEDQTYHLFDSDGLLTKVVDAAGNEITITRDSQNDDRITAITDAAGRPFNFTYNVSDELTKITDAEEDDDPEHLADRDWSITLTSGRLSKVTDPELNDIEFVYDNDGRITGLTDKDGDEFDYSYSSDRIDTVTDPTPTSPLTQEFAYAVLMSGNTETTYTDRRGSDWIYEFDDNDDLVAFENPEGDTRALTYDTDHNVTDFVDGESKTWEATYDANGNLLTLTDPLDNEQSWEYDTYNNVTCYTDGEANTYEFEYMATGISPTLLTAYIEPADGQGNGEARTELEYYTDDESEPAGEGWGDDAWNGLLKEVYDPQDVWFGFKYDRWGQLAEEHEGQVEVSPGFSPVWSMDMIYGSASRLTSVDPPASGGTMSHDLLNRVTGNECIPIQPNPLPIGCPPVPSGFPELPCSPDNPGPTHFATFDAEYSPMGQVTDFDVLISNGSSSDTRDFTMQYDELGFLIDSEVVTDEPGTQITRDFEYDPDWATGRITRTGPDGVETLIEFDDAWRVSFVRRGPAMTPLMTAEYTYDGNGRVTVVEFLNGATANYTYDDAGRTTEIKHLSAIGFVDLKLTYTYTDHNLPATITEGVRGGTVATTTFTYDNLGRLIAEDRTASPAYDLEYEYDQSGNRKKKIDNVAHREWVYTYDIDAPGTYGSANNRLMFYKEYDTTGVSRILESTTWYYYNESGNVTRVVTNEEGTDDYVAHRMDYFTNGQAVEYVMGETWEWDGNRENDPTDYDVTYARQFRYDGARQRYMNRKLKLTDYSDDGTTWSDYDGDYVYGDYTISGAMPGVTITEERSFELGVGVTEDPAGTPSTEFYHGNLIGTTRHMSDGSGAKTDSVVYTAFGERVSGTNHRYGYAGAWGYQTDDTATFPFLHVGHRYYDPATGRFLQRDPIGIRGGTNVYAYVGNDPALAVDPEGFAKRKAKPKTGRMRGGSLRYGRSTGPGGTYNSWAFRWGPPGGTHLWGWRGAAAFGGCVAVAAGVGTAAGLAIDHFILKPRDDNQFERDLANLNGSMSPHDPSDPWGWAKGTDWER